MSCKPMSTLAERRNEISEMLAADVDKIEDAFRRQTGIIEERTGTMERALSAGVDNVRNVLEQQRRSSSPARCARRFWKSPPR